MSEPGKPLTRMERAYMEQLRRRDTESRLISKPPDGTTQEKVRAALEAYDAGDRSEYAVRVHYWARLRGGCHACAHPGPKPTVVSEMTGTPSEN